MRDTGHAPKLKKGPAFLSFELKMAAAPRASDDLPFGGRPQYTAPAGSWVGSGACAEAGPGPPLLTTPLSGSPDPAAPAPANVFTQVQLARGKKKVRQTVHLFTSCMHIPPDWATTACGGGGLTANLPPPSTASQAFIHIYSETFCTIYLNKDHKYRKAWTTKQNFMYSSKHIYRFLDWLLYHYILKQFSVSA